MKRKQFAIIGLGRFGSAMASTLVELGQDVIGVDSEPERVRALADTLTQAVELDAIDERALKAAGIHNIESSLLVVMLLKELGIKTIVAKAVTALHGRILEKLGVSRVVFPEREMATRTAHSLVMPNAIDYIELSRDFSIVELPAPAQFIGKNLKQLEMRPRFGLTLVAIKRRDGQTEVTNIAPGADEVIREGDVLALLGNISDLKRLDAELKR